MIPNKIYLNAPINLDKVKISLWPFNTHYETLPPEVKTEVDRLWLIRLAKAQETGYKLYEGSLLRFDSITHSKDGNIIINVSLVDFSYALVIREIYDNPDFDLYNKYGESLYPQHLTAGALVYSVEGTVVLGIKEYMKNGEKISNKDIIGGVISADEILSFEQGIDFEVAADKELHEELNIEPKHILKYIPRCIVRNSGGNIMIFFEIHLDLTESEITERFLKREDKELARIEFVKPHEVAEILKEEWGDRNEALQEVIAIN